MSTVNSEAEPPTSLVERRAFMRLPLEERRRVLQNQAQALKEHYDQDREWRNLEAGDFVDYWSGLAPSG